MITDEIKYIAEPTTAKFHNSKAFVRGIRGPIGSGKTVACCAEIFKVGLLQQPFQQIRRTRWAFVRNTYPELKTTTVKTWLDWFGPVTKISYDSPIRAISTIPQADGTVSEIESYFIALDKPKDTKKLKSLELTGVFINEASEIPKAVLDMATGRVNRYPAKKHGGPTWTGVIMDTNSCDDDHWWYVLAETEKPQGWEFFSQPAALLKLTQQKMHTTGFVCDREGNRYIPNPGAENVQHQPGGYGYWLNQVPGKRSDWVSIFICNEYGTLTDGKPVHPNYTDSKHLSDLPLVAVPDLAITLGWDFGLTPACAICQEMPSGQFRVLEELNVKEHGQMGIRQFTKEIVRPHLERHYQNQIQRRLIYSYGDPAGNQKTQTDEMTCIMVLDEVLADLKIFTSPSITNATTARRDALDKYLNDDIDGKPAFLLSPTCRYIRKGLRGAFRYERVQVTGDERFRDVPLKNIYSHIIEALQYAALMTRPETWRQIDKKSPHDERIENLYKTSKGEYEDYAGYEQDAEHRRLQSDEEDEGGGYDHDLVSTVY